MAPRHSAERQPLPHPYPDVTGVDGAAALLSGKGAPGASQRIPAPLPTLNSPPLDVGTYPARSVEAEDFARRIGNWGSAARDIGERWESVGLDRLRRRLPWTLLVGGGRAMRVERILRIDSGDAGVALQRAGVSAPDLVLIGTVASASGPKVAVRAADLKVSLDTAERTQTASARLQAAFARMAESMPLACEAVRAEARLQDVDGPLAHDFVSQGLSGDWSGLALIEGLFIAPDTGFNRWFLQEMENRRRTGRGAPRLPFRGRRRDDEQVDGAMAGLPAHLEPVTAAEFLGGLAGWPEAGLVARLDGIDLDAVDPSIAERCWRVGNGLRGALLAIRRRLLEPPTELRDASGLPTSVVPILDRVLTREMASSGALVRAIADALDRRRAAWDDEARVLAFPIGFDTWEAWFTEARPQVAGSDPVDPAIAEALASLGADPSQADDGARREFIRACRAAHRASTQRHRARVVNAAREAYASGLDEAATLESIRARHDEWVDAVRLDASRLDPEVVTDLPRS